MRKRVLVATCLLMATVAQADDLPVTAPVTEAVIYLQGATLTRAGTVEAPAGQHRLLIPMPGDGPVPRIALTGAQLGAVAILPGAQTDGRPWLTTAQASALAMLEAAEDALHAAESDQIRDAAALKAAEDRLAFLRSITGAALTTLDAETITQTATAVGQATAAAEADRADARAALRSAEQSVTQARRQVAQAKRDLDASGANLGPVTLLAVDVNVPQPGPVTVTLNRFSEAAGWSPAYDVRLTEGQGVTLDRKATVWQRSGVPFADVALTLSTADPFAQVAPTTVWPNQAQIVEPQPRVSVRTEALQADAPMRPAMTELAAPVIVRANVEGPVVTYTPPAPVTLPSGAGSVTLTLGTLTLDARIFNRAAPRVDQTAFRMAEVTNSTAEPLLPGPAALFRDGARIGETELPLWPAGETTDLAFGPQHHLQLEFRALDNETGDRGVFVTSGTRRQDLLFRVRNLSDQPEVVETRFALPFSEQEDLDLTVRASPAPDTPTVEDRRGVAEWILEAAPRDTVEVRIGVTLEWPDDQVLVWRP